jgi:hypothetical protein
MLHRGLDENIQIIQRNDRIDADKTDEKDDQDIADDQSVENCQFQLPSPAALDFRQASSCRSRS